MRTIQHAAGLIELDGTYGEGGGALLRTALTMSTLTQQPFRLTHVRGGTHHPGMDLEDELIVQGMASACAAEVVGGSVGSQSIAFTPTRGIGPIALATGAGPTQGRGANSLVVLGSLLPILTRTGAYSELDIVGESYGPNTLTYDYFAEVTLRAGRCMGLYATSQLVVAGFGRENYGQVHLEVEPGPINGVDWPSRGALRACRGVVTSAQLPPTISARAVSHLERLAHFAGIPLKIETADVSGSSPGSVITLWVEYEHGLGGVASVGARGVRVETIAQAALDALVSFMMSDATVDSYLADQMLLQAIVANSPTHFTVPRLTKRLLTMIWVVKQFSPIRITVVGAEGTPGSVTIQA